MGLGRILKTFSTVPSQKGCECPVDDFVSLVRILNELLFG